MNPKIQSIKSLESSYLELDKEQSRTANNINLIPPIQFRRGGKRGYAEWAHVTGIFQTLIHMNLEPAENNHILDVGCGTGLLAIASRPFLGPNGLYTGIDVQKADIKFCRRHYPSGNFKFVHLNAHNPRYAPDQEKNQTAWNIDDASMDLVTALSVWTHFSETDAMFYLKEVYRVLKPGRKAIISFFALPTQYSPAYKEAKSQPDKKTSKFHSKPFRAFEQPCYDSTDWFHAGRGKVPEAAIGITAKGLKRLFSHSRLKRTAHYPGTWSERAGLYYQDILVLQKGG